MTFFMTHKILFILKRREDYNPVAHSPMGLSTGLYNSASFVRDMCNEIGIATELEVAIDNNCIDRLVNKHRPTHVIIEALWVVPTKFVVLQKLHPNVKWIIRLHSEMPFLAGEGMAMDWLGEYINFENVDIGVNAPRMLDEVQTFLSVKQGLSHKEISKRVYYLPNYYPQDYVQKLFCPRKDKIKISCFGAVRPLKNHMVQAVAAVKFAESIGRKLEFHINGGRIEMKGDSVMNNLRAFFQHLAPRGHKMIMHKWTPREEFLEICAKMDIGLQVSFSETFNIVGADLISQGVPIVGSKEIPFASHYFNADPTSSNDIAEKLTSVWNSPDFNVAENQKNLSKYTETTKSIWLDQFKENQHE